MIHSVADQVLLLLPGRVSGSLCAAGTSSTSPHETVNRSVAVTNMFDHMPQRQADESEPVPAFPLQTRSPVEDHIPLLVSLYSRTFITTNTLLAASGERQWNAVSNVLIVVTKRVYCSNAFAVFRLSRESFAFSIFTIRGGSTSSSVWSRLFVPSGHLQAATCVGGFLAACRQVNEECDTWLLN